MGSAAVAGCAGGSDGGSGERSSDTGSPTDNGSTGTAAGTGPGTEAPAGALSFSTPAFEDGGTIPPRYTGVDEDVSPELVVESVPDVADTLALVVTDPDADGFVHWVLWNVPADVGTIPEGIPRGEAVRSLDGALQGTNDFGELGYRGPLPPEGDGPHTYRFAMSAVDTAVDLAVGGTRSELTTALDGHVVATARISGEFER